MNVNCIKILRTTVPNLYVFQDGSVGDVLFDIEYQVAGGSVAIVVKDIFAVWGQYLTNVSQKPKLF